MLDMMVASRDPRLRVVFDTVFDSDTATRYVGLPSSPDSQPATADTAHLSRLNALMFRHNDNFPGYDMTAAEVKFLKAEAYMRGWAAGNAKAAYDSAITLSVEMYYATYNRNSFAVPKATAPPPDTVTAFINGPAVVYDGTLQRIATQKWIHLGIVQPYEAWAELRRTDYPELPQDVIGGRPLERPVRDLDPSSENTSNNQNYQAVRPQDTPTTRGRWGV